MQLPAPLHRSTVQGFPSLEQAAVAGSTQLWAASLHVCGQMGPPAHGLPACVLHAPPLQVSAPLQNSPSLQGAVLLVWTHAPAALQWSSVHGLPSLVQVALAGSK